MDLNSIKIRQAETSLHHIDPILGRMGYVLNLRDHESCMNLSAYNNIGLVAFFRPALLWFTFHLLRNLAIMKFTTPPSTPTYKSACSTCQETKVRGSDTSQV